MTPSPSSSSDGEIGSGKGSALSNKVSPTPEEHLAALRLLLVLFRR